MMRSVEARVLLDKFNNASGNQSGCGEIYCGNCGGSAALILRDKEALHDEVASVLSSVV